VLVRLDHVASVVVDANHCAVRAFHCACG
jgi:hypothetical protein